MEKMLPFEMVPGMGRGRIKENVKGMNSSMIYLIYCKDLYK
jgi:hypothetical protein